MREAGYHTSLLGKAHLYLDENLTVPHIDDMAGRLEALGFAEVFETGDKFVGKIPNRYTDYLSDRGLLDAYKQHIADRSYQGENEDGQNATKCVPMWDSTPMPLPLDAYVDTWHGHEAVQVDRGTTTARSRSSSSSGSPGPTTRGTRPRRRCSATATSTSPCRARPAARPSRGRVATAPS